MRTKKDQLHLVSISYYAANTLGVKCKKPLSVKHVYKQIKAHQKGTKIPFKYVKLGKVFWIIAQ